MTDSSVLLERADLLLEQGRFKDAEMAIKEVLQQHPQNDHALALLARCYLNSQRLDEGIEMASKAIALNPVNSFYFYLLAFGYYHKNLGFAAITNIQKAIELYPYNAEYFGLQAYIFIDEREFEKALEKATEGLALDGESSICLNARSTALNKLGKISAAIETMQDALAQNPDHEMTHATVGWNLLEKGRHKEAMHHFREALRIRPDYTTAQNGLKEALKSKIPPYRWLLQYSFWINNRGKRLQVIMPIAIYVFFRIVIAGFVLTDSPAPFAWIAGGIYILFVVSTWTMNSIANCFLLVHPVGKHALNNSEKWSSVTSVAALLLGLSILIIHFGTAWATHTAYGDTLFFAGLVSISLALPLSQLQYPLTVKHKARTELFSTGFAALGLASLVLYVLLPDVALMVFGLYAVAFIIYNWTGLGR